MVGWELKPESVGGKAREDMQVHVEDVLSGCGTVCEEEVDALATQHRLPQRCGGTLPDAEQLCAILRIEFGERGCVLTRYDEQVPGRQRLDVQERKRPFVFVNDAGLEFAGDDPTEDAIRCFRHAYDPTAALIAKRIITHVGQRPGMSPERSSVFRIVASDEPTYKLTQQFDKRAEDVSYHRLASRRA